MDHQKKLDFVNKMTKLALEHVSRPEVQHLDDGGTVLGGPAPAAGNTSSTTGGGLITPINSVLGLNNNFQAQSANIQNGTNAAQLNAAYTGAQSGLTQQQNVANTLTPSIAQGANAESNVEGQLANEAAGQGANPAQAALNQSTGQNIAQTAALMAGQRGAGANAGALATAAANQGAATQQTAVGQAATLQAQQQLAAQQEEAGIASNQITQGANAVTGVNQTQQNEQNILQGSNTSANNANVAMQSNINNVNAGVSTANQNMNANTFGGLLSAASSGSSLFAKGGLVKMDKGGNVLDANARKHIAPEHFALPGRRYPIHDIEHARNALARVSQNGTPAEKNKVKTAVHKAYPSLAGKSAPKNMADGGDVQSNQETSFQPTSSDTSNGPDVASSAALPADNTNFAKDINQPSSSSGGGSSGGGGLSSLGGLAALMARGGEVKNGFMKLRMAGGGYIPPQSLSPGGSTAAPQSYVGQFVNTASNVSNGPNVGGSLNLPQNNTSFSKAVQGTQNKKQPQLKTTDDSSTTGANAGATDLAPQNQSQPTDNALPDNSQVMTAYRGGLAATGGNVKAGKGEKAVVKGDSLKNDKVPTMLSSGEIVIPRHISMAVNAPEKAAEFVRMTLAKRKK